MSNGSPGRQVAFYAWLRTVTVVAIALLAIESFLVLGIVTPVAIHGSSMAPTMLGPHVDVTCTHCNWQFAVGTDQLPQKRPMLCPDCQREFDSPSIQTHLPGQRVWVNRIAEPSRWDIVVFRCPEQTTEYSIKRVLGLPDEHVDFSKGDLVINGHVLRKSLPEQYQVRQLVHRERGAESQWQTDETNWQRFGDEWRHTGQLAQPLFFALTGRAATDELGYNQNVTRATNRVTDLMVTFELKLSPNSTARCFAEFADGTVLMSPVVSNSASVEWSLFDRQALLAVDGRTVSVQQRAAPWPGPPLLQIYAEGEATVRNLCVWRDAYYHTRPVDRWPAAGVQLGTDVLFVVGDNVAISEDSRTWAHHGLPRSLLVGVPIGSQ